jgi:hypothetical protein
VIAFLIATYPLWAAFVTVTGVALLAHSLATSAPRPVGTDEEG